MIIPSQAADMHVHTQHSHDCTTPLLQIRDLARKHELMLAITDHNRISGNIAAKKIGVNVIPAIEVTTRSLKDFLVYFHHQDSMEEFYQKYVQPALNPGIIFGSRTKLSNKSLLEALGKYNCITSLAHPYCPFPKRSAKIKDEHMRRLDAIEVLNHSMSPRANRAASLLREKYGKSFTAGSDSHHISTVANVTMRGHSNEAHHFLAEVAQRHAVVLGEKRSNRDVANKAMHYYASLKARN